MPINYTYLTAILVCLVGLFYWSSSPNQAAMSSLLPKIVSPYDETLEAGCTLQKDMYTIYNRHMTMYEFLDVSPDASKSAIVQALQKIQRESKAATNTCAAAPSLCPEHYRAQLDKLALADRVVLFLLQSQAQRDRYDAEIYFALAHVAVLDEEDRVSASAARDNDVGDKGWGWKWPTRGWAVESNSDRKLRMIRDKITKKNEAQAEAGQSFTQLCGNWVV
ncbi:hypothetical protein CGGC5_v017345 [Colletotrichum fructicola Nara gc5]|uniref:Uncharacterized protein n=1 Tax=Colletotrichum fructicola (strain Nara gc5) TaxID=1213859 RepID=A0A7J6IE52_COLFN|nr:hypothetical protein CFRS1_v015274 [Colletotrichum fructicola]KAF4473622.1 hypothetical protein CGGC5_v017345 [Colletotrichum fructicola Nara gc5]KAF4882785.1 hypothetical protein CGCFRS4_v014223 [Colletotrichum fructicola]